MSGCSHRQIDPTTGSRISGPTSSHPSPARTANPQRNPTANPPSGVAQRAGGEPNLCRTSNATQETSEIRGL